MQNNIRIKKDSSAKQFYIAVFLSNAFYFQVVVQTLSVNLELYQPPENFTKHFRVKPIFGHGKDAQWG
jgi:hypothetical protein